MIYESHDGKELIEVSSTPYLDFFRRKKMNAFPKESFAKETPYRADSGNVAAPTVEEVFRTSTLLDVVKEPTVEETLTIPSAPLPSDDYTQQYPTTLSLTVEGLFAKQDALRRRFTNLKKYIVDEVPKSDEKIAGLVKLDEALASLVVGLTKEMK